MANKVVTISQTTSNLSSDYLYLDLNMKSDPLKLSKSASNDAEKILRAERDGTQLSDIVATFSDETQKLIRLYLKDDNNYYNAVVEFAKKAKYQIASLKDVEAVKSSIKNIFTWTPGERIINPEFGTNLRKYLYNGITDFNSEQIMAEIRHAFQQWEPRAQLEKVINISTIDETEDNTIHIQIVYSIPSLSNRQTYSQDITYTIT